MRVLPIVPCLVLACLTAGAAVAAENVTKIRAQCASFGFQEGTEGFANCVMRLTLQERGRQPPDHFTLVRRYRERSMARRGDDRYAVCTAGMMENELDIDTGKWVGPDCQMAPN